MKMLTVKMADSEHDGLRELAKARGETMADTVRAGLSCLRYLPVDTRPVPRVAKPGGLARAAKAAVLDRVEQRQLHEHVAGPMLSGGIHVCSVKGCEARKVGGRWIEGR